MQEQPPKAEHAAEEKINWLKLATKFSADGDLKVMRACAKEVDRLMAGDICGSSGSTVFLALNLISFWTNR